MITELEVTKDDYKTFSKFVISRLTSLKEISPWQRIINLCKWIFVVVMIVFTIIQLTGISFTLFHWPTALITSIPFALIISLFIGHFSRLEKKLMPSENGLMLDKKTIEIKISGIECTNALCASVYKWQALQEVVVHEKNVYLFLDTMLAQIIPSSAFNNQVEATEFAARIEKMRNRVLQTAVE